MYQKKSLNLFLENILCEFQSRENYSSVSCILHGLVTLQQTNVPFIDINYKGVWECSYLQVRLNKGQNGQAGLGQWFQQPPLNLKFRGIQDVACFFSVYPFELKIYSGSFYKSKSSNMSIENQFAKQALNVRRVKYFYSSQGGLPQSFTLIEFTKSRMTTSINAMLNTSNTHY